MTAWTEDIIAVVGVKAPETATALLDGSRDGDVSGPEYEDGIQIAERAAVDGHGLIESVRMAVAQSGAIDGAVVNVNVGLSRKETRLEDVVSVVGAVVGFVGAVALAFLVASFLPHGGWQRVIAAVITIVGWPLCAAAFIAPVELLRRRRREMKENAALEKYGRARFDALVASVRARLTT